MMVWEMWRAVGAPPGRTESMGPLPIARGTVKSLIVRDRPVELGGVGNWSWTRYADDGKTSGWVYPGFLVIHQEDGSRRVVPHGWYEILEIR